RVRWNRVTARTEENLPPPEAAGADDARRLAAHAAFLNGDLRLILANYEAAPWVAVSPLEIAMIGEALADGGQEAALAAAQEVRPYQPAEADAIAARYLWSQGRFAECYDATVKAVRRYQQDPWPLSPVMQRLFAIVAELPAKDARLAQPLYDLLEPHFPLWL